MQQLCVLETPFPHEHEFPLSQICCPGKYECSIACHIRVGIPNCELLESFLG